jgi:hypothetical protein
MISRPVDPRFIQREPPAVYHVYFWSDRQLRSDEYELTEVRNVHEVLDWASRNANGREIEICAVIDNQAVYLIGPLDHSSPVPDRAP